MKVYYVKGVNQLGDSIYIRPFVRRLLEEGNEVYLRTPYPGLYRFSGPPVKFVRPELTHKTAKRAILETDVEFVDAPENAEVEVDALYNGQDLKRRGIMPSIEARFGFDPGSTQPLALDLPPLPSHRLNLPKGRKIAVVRPVTFRKEFPCLTRAPEPRYLGWIAKVLRDSGHYVISIADLDDGEELVEAVPADLTLHHGELGILGTLSLIKGSDLAVGGSGFIVPAALAAGTPLYIVFGGRGEYDNPQKLLDLRMDLSRVGWVLPDRFCRCNKHEHDCDKTISDLDSKLFSFLKTL